MPTFDYDLFVIGGGSGGVRAARMAAQRGVRVALAEAGALGGTCVNVGCIPKKLYSYAAHYGEAFQESRAYGWDFEGLRFDWARLKANRAVEITRLNGIYAGLLKSAGVAVLNGWAKLADGHTVEVDGKRVTAQHILLATGGQPSVPDVPWRHEVLVSDDLFDLPTFPRRLLVVGGGYIASEMASIFHGLGAEVTQVLRGDTLLRGFDADISTFLAAEMRKTGVQLRLGTQVSGLVRHDGYLTAQLQTGDSTLPLPVDAVLYATGRTPKTAGMGLAEAGVQLNESGAVVVDGRYASSVPSVFALGDVSSRLQLTPVALGEAMALVDDLFGPVRGKPVRHMAYDYIPTAVFTHPNVGTVGFTEAEARAEFGAIDVYRSEFKILKHTLSGSSERTLVKLLVEKATDRVVGLHMVGPDAGEIVQGFAVALKAGATKAVFDQTIGIHPTLAEEFVTLREPVQ
jgi:glutathione reductase (NADPH)